MKLSEAIRLGQFLLTRVRLGGVGEEGCALQMACMDIGRKDLIKDYNYFQGVEEEFGASFRLRRQVWIWHDVRDRKGGDGFRYSIDQIADMVAEIEDREEMKCTSNKDVVVESIPIIA